MPMTSLNGRLESFTRTHVRSCMNTSGWDWFVEEPNGISYEEITGKGFEGAGMTEMQIASIEVATGERELPKNLNAAKVKTMSAMETETYKSDLDGCRRDARRLLAPVDRKLQSAALSQTKLVKSPGTGKWEREWSSCMRGRGFKFRTDDEMFESVTDKIEAAHQNLVVLRSEVLPYDIAVTKAHRKCFSQTEGADTSFKKANRTVLADIKQFETEALSAMAELERTQNK